MQWKLEELLLPRYLETAHRFYLAIVQLQARVCVSVCVCLTYLRMHPPGCCKTSADVDIHKYLLGGFLYFCGVFVGLFLLFWEAEEKQVLNDKSQTDSCSAGGSSAGLSELLHSPRSVLGPRHPRVTSSQLLWWLPVLLWPLCSPVPQSVRPRAIPRDGNTPEDALQAGPWAQESSCPAASQLPVQEGSCPAGICHFQCWLLLSVFQISRSGVC